jgi:hypothetical protein
MPTGTFRRVLYSVRRHVEVFDMRRTTQEPTRISAAHYHEPAADARQRAFHY